MTRLNHILPASAKQSIGMRMSEKEQGLRTWSERSSTFTSSSFAFITLKEALHAHVQRVSTYS